METAVSVERRTATAHAALLAVVVVWASAFSVIKALLDHGFVAEDIAILRYLVAAPGFAYLLWRVGGLPGPDPARRAQARRRRRLRRRRLPRLPERGHEVHDVGDGGARHRPLPRADAPARDRPRPRELEPAPRRRPGGRLRGRRHRRPARRRRRALLRQREGPADRPRRADRLRALQRAPEAAARPLRPARAHGGNQPRRHGLPPAVRRRRHGRRGHRASPARTRCSCSTSASPRRSSATSAGTSACAGSAPRARWPTRT